MRPHQGLDLRANVGTPVFAVGKGKVVYVQRNEASGGDYGKQIVIQFKYEYSLLNFLEDVFTFRWGEIGKKLEANGKTMYAMYGHLSYVRRLHDG